ncbi:MAG: ATP-binding protein, partial [Gemmatimonadales bacterium]|nr:ATP-binding protein [Gemmatimonadales bacterium]
MTSNDGGAVIGRVVATEALPAGPHEFHFWTALETPIGIGAIVRVAADRLRAVYAVVVDGRAYSDLQTPLHEVLAAEGDPASDRGPTRRAEVRLWKAAVLRHEPDEPVQPVPLGAVHLATQHDVEFALRMDTYVGARGIPVGVYRSGGLAAAVSLDADFLLGPESAHLNISGVSGLATKTSAVEFLLASVFQHLPERKGTVAAICFNVKGPDLSFLDQPGELTDADRELYRVLHVDPRPFE